MKNITPHFKLNEFKVSDQFPELAEKIQLSEQDDLKLYCLCSTILEPVREQFGPVTILSGKRSEELNEAVGGSPTTDHYFENVSCAADFCLSSNNTYSAYEWMREKLSFAYGQLIWYPTKRFIHVSLPTPKHRWETLVNSPYR